MKSFDLVGEEFCIEFSLPKKQFQNTLDCIKALKGRRFNGKEWFAKANKENYDALLFLRFIPSDAVRQKFDPQSNISFVCLRTPVSNLPEGLRPYQVEGVEFLEAVNGRGIVAFEPRCVSGEALVTLNRGGNGRKYKISYLYEAFHGKPKRAWDLSIPTNIRGLKQDGTFGLLRVKDVYFSGMKQAYKITTSDGKSLETSQDHLFMRDTMEWAPLSDLHIGEHIIVNGITACPRCGKTENLVTYKYAKYVGYCKTCMCELREDSKGYSRKYLSPYDGYVYLTFPELKKHPKWRRQGIVEHRLVMEKLLGRYLLDEEEVHHINKNRSDNRPENLEVLSRSEHKRRHKTERHFKTFIHRNGSEVVVIPKVVEVVSIEKTTVIPMYDISVEGPEHNFVANGILVHNCGKTLTSLAWTYAHPRARPILVICPANAKISWYREVEKWTKEKAQILYGRTPYEIDQDTQVIIINYDILWDWYTVLDALKCKVMIIDECHYLASPGERKKNSEGNFVFVPVKRTQAFKSLSKSIPHIIALSGTPITRCPSQFFEVLHAVNPELFPKRQQFLEEFCEPKYNGFSWVYNGLTNVQRLRGLLSHVMIRKRKVDVFDDLPKEQKIVVPLEIDKAAYTKEAQEYTEWFSQNNGADEEDIARRLRLLKSISYDAKRSQIIEWIKDFIDTGEPLVVFCYHRDVCEDIHKAFKKQSVLVYGGMTAQKRQEAIDNFQKDDTIPLFVGQVKACNVAISLSKSSTVAFIELPDTPGDLKQAQERIFMPHDGKEFITHYFLVAADTVDEDRAISLEKRSQIVNAVLDDGKEEKLFGVKIKRGFSGLTETGGLSSI